MNIKKIAELLQQFATERDWNQFHTPKNLATSIAVESAELLEIFQWTRGQFDWEEVRNESALKEHVEEELADILLYLIRFADLANIDLQQAALRKIKINEEKYPVERCKGSDKKYHEHQT